MQYSTSIWSNYGPTYSKAVKTAYTQRRDLHQIILFFTSTNNTCFLPEKDVTTGILVEKPTIQTLTQEQTDNTARIACNSKRLNR